uniref:Uncharacterized protein n=1 Tax=Leersia perrieri TaxID=77586 RepID=A0A0D9VMY0_9ORYZ
MTYWHWNTDDDPLYFLDVPLLSSLRLIDASAGWQKILRFGFTQNAQNYWSLSSRILTRLELQNLHIAEPNIYNMLSTCKHLKSLQLCHCVTHADQVVLQLEHTQLVGLKILCGNFILVELKCLPKLKIMAYRNWGTYWDPFSFGGVGVPLLSSLRLSDAASGWQKILRLSQFLSNIWVHPECPKLLGHVFHKLQRIMKWGKDAAEVAISEQVSEDEERGPFETIERISARNTRVAGAAVQNVSSKRRRQMERAKRFAQAE